MVKVVISRFRSLKSKNRCRIRIQRLEKHAKVASLEKKFSEKFAEKMRWGPPFIIEPKYLCEIFLSLLLHKFLC